MQKRRGAADGHAVGRVCAEAHAGMLNVDDVGRILRCSPRTVYRLADSGRMPSPVKLNALVRWPRAIVEGWIAEGCPHCERRGAGHAG